MKTIKQWVDGAYYEGTPTGRFPVENPATGQVEAELLQASEEDLDHVVGWLARPRRSGRATPSPSAPPSCSGCASWSSITRTRWRG